MMLYLSAGWLIATVSWLHSSPEEQVFFALTLRLPTAFFRVMGKFFSQSRKRVYAS
jgi:hypothetical protein